VDYTPDPLAEIVIGCAIEVHQQLGPGLMESAYQRCLAYELTAKRISFVQDQLLPLNYKNVQLYCGYRLDLLVEQRLVVELKAVEQLLPVHKAQVLTYLKLLKVRQGLLINFNVPRLVDGLRSLIRAST
jgi:GxxExxY protein